jgi:hypothetical protein
MTPSPFDRLAGTRRNKRWRNACGIGAAAFFFLAAILILDPIVSGTPAHVGWLLLLGLVCIVLVSFATYFHMRFLTRE